MQLDRRALAKSMGLTLGCAIVGNSLTGDALTTWYPRLRKSRLVLPIWGFIPVAILYYMMCGVLLYRLQTNVPPSRARRQALALTVAMMVANEGWNYLLFGWRSTRAGLFGMIGFVALTLQLYRTLRRVDQRSAQILAFYIAWLGYDLLYAFELWRLNKEG